MNEQIIAELKITDVNTKYHVIRHRENSNSMSSFDLSELEFRQFEFEPGVKYEVEAY